VFEALWRLARRSLKSRALVGVAVLAFASLLLGAPFPLVVLVAGVSGALLAKGDAPANGEAGAIPLRTRDTLLTAIVWLAIWLTPVLLAVAVFGPGSALGRMGVFFSQAALVTFGGAYAVLAYVAQAAVRPSAG
jgi:chromate transporter